MSEFKTDKTKSKFEALFELGVSRMHSALGAYCVWKWMNIAINLNQAGGEKMVKRNLEIMNRHVIFFGQILRSTYKSFIADLSIFFDKNGYDGTFSIKKLLEATRDKLTIADIGDIRTEIEKIKAKHKASIAFLRELRNADVAHQETDSRARHLLYENMEGLFVAIQDILNIISKKYNNSEHWWNHVNPEVERQMNWIMDNLERGESARLKEIEKEFGL